MEKETKEKNLEDDKFWKELVASPDPNENLAFVGSLRGQQAVDEAIPQGGLLFAEPPLVMWSPSACSLGPAAWV